MLIRAPARLVEFQRQFSRTLRVPLDRTSGSLQTSPKRYDSELCAAVRSTYGPRSAERLAVYNRQYWFRLFTALQNEIRLGTALLGAWSFNDLASRYLLVHPPQGHDLATVAEHFATFVEDSVADAEVKATEAAEVMPKRALVEAIRIDLAHRRVTTARASPALSEILPSQVAAARLVPSPTVVLIDEHWPLVALRHELPADGHRAVTLPSPHATRMTWAIARTRAGVRAVCLEPLQATLLRQLTTCGIAEALAILEAGCTASDVEVLIARTPAWLAQSVELGMWSALVEDRG